jgi:hypothetical protein
LGLTTGSTDGITVSARSPSSFCVCFFFAIANVVYITKKKG